MKSSLLKLIPFFIFFGLLSCTEADKDSTLNVREGEINIAADESLKFIAQAQVNAYKTHYPKATINLILAPEQQAIGLMLKDSVDVAITSRHLNPKEQEYFTQREMEYQPAPMAMDAVVLIVHPDSPLDSIDTKSIAAILDNTDNSEMKLVFDHSSSSTLNFMLEKFNITQVNNDRMFAAEGTQNVFDVVAKRKNTIGVVGYNWISDIEDPRAQNLKDGIKILAVSEKGQSAIIPKLSSLKEKTYPLRKIVYLHTTQDRWGVAKGFVRFACSQLGQLVVEKMELQPYYLIPKKYDMTDTPEIITVH